MSFRPPPRSLYLFLSVLLLAATPAAAQSDDDDSLRKRVDTVVDALADPDLPIEVTVAAGVVTLDGTVASLQQERSILDAVAKLDGVVAVDDELEQSTDLSDRLEPAQQRFTEMINHTVAMAPLVVLAIAILTLFLLLSRAVNWLEPVFTKGIRTESVRRVVMQVVRAVVILIGFVLALEVLDATALVGGLLGAAGVAGIAIGFAFRDLIENYIASIMLSLRQPFRSGDHVLINDHEGIVATLTSRSTILVSLDGNRLRIPNSEVFKSVILNYSTTPQRRFEFTVGIGNDVNPTEAIAVGVCTLAEMDAVLDDPPPIGRVMELGDSSQIVKFFAWVDQTKSDFGLARSAAISEIKRVFDERDLEMPEPTYNLRIIAQAHPGEPGPSRKPEREPGPVVAELSEHHAGSETEFAREEATREAERTEENEGLD